MIRGRLVQVNGRDVAPADYAEERAQRLVDREFNLSNALQAPAHNPITAGRWTPGEADGASVEEGIAKTLGLKLGDQLRFDRRGAACCAHHQPAQGGLGQHAGQLLCDVPGGAT
jgi:putative ABC transport system permease protein